MLKHILTFFFISIAAVQIYSQGKTDSVIIVDPATFPVVTEPDDTNFEFYSRKLGTNVKSSYTQVRKRMLPIGGGTVSYTPAPSGNSAARRGLITKNAAGDIHYVDGFGVGVKISSGTSGATYLIYDDDYQAAASCVSIYELSANNPYGYTAGTIRKRKYGTLSNCQ